MQLELQVHPTVTLATEFAKVTFEVPGREKPHLLDVDFSSALDRCREYTPAALDFLLVAASVYAVDKAVSRAGNDGDRWTRELGVTIPVRDAVVWNAVADDFSACLSFLTGDVWQIRFAATTSSLARIRPNRRRAPKPLLAATAASLFSGGLDSFVGAVDYLSENEDNKLVVVSHYERHVKGPMSDQDELFAALTARFPERIDHFQLRVGLHDAGAEISFRSRSLLFLALGMLVADNLGPKVPVFIPENGPIALNMPLSPTRRGSCSTRTAHPNFLKQLESIVARVGLDHSISNRYEFQTKGEMVTKCAEPAFLAQHVGATVSCAKAGRKIGWASGVKACGTCVPCLFRRASLHAECLDTEQYYKDVCGAGITHSDLTADTLALLSLLKRDPSPQEISRALCANGLVVSGDLSEYAGVVARMIKEVRNWLKAKASAAVRTLASA